MPYEVLSVGTVIAEAVWWRRRGSARERRASKQRRDVRSLGRSFVLAELIILDEDLLEYRLGERGGAVGC